MLAVSSLAILGTPGRGASQQGSRLHVVVADVTQLLGREVAQFPGSMG